METCSFPDGGGGGTGSALPRFGFPELALLLKKTRLPGQGCQIFIGKTNQIWEKCTKMGTGMIIT
jgi:hypothetical protein